MKIKDFIQEINTYFKADALAVICYFGCAFGQNYYKKIIDIKEMDVMSCKLSRTKKSNEFIKAACLVVSELDSINKVISVENILFMLSKFDKELDVYCIDDCFNVDIYSSVSELCSIIDGAEDPDLEDFRNVHNDCSILEIIV